MLQKEKGVKIALHPFNRLGNKVGQTPGGLSREGYLTINCIVCIYMLTPITSVVSRIAINPYSAPVETMTPPENFNFGGGGGSRTRVQKPFEKDSLRSLFG